MSIEFEKRDVLADELRVGTDSPVFPTAPADTLIGQEIEALVKLVSVRFPKKRVEDIQPSEFAIIGLSIVSLEKGVLPEEMNNGFGSRQCFNNVVAKGRVPQLEFGVVYYYRGTLVEDIRYGLQYDTNEFHKVYDISTKEQKEKFLRLVLTPAKAQLLLDNFEDPCDVLQNGDLEALCKVKGIQKATAKRMIEDYNKNLGQGDILLQLEKYNLTQNQIDSMLKVYKSVDTVLYFLKNDPYAFISTVKGIGWEKADTIGINSGVDPCGPQRIAAFVNYYLESQARNIGHLWTDLCELATAVDRIAPYLDPIELKNMLNRWTGRDTTYTGPKWLYYDETKNRIGLLYYRKLEEDIAHELMRIQHADNKLYDSEEIEDAIKRTELACGFEYTEEQKEAMRLCFNNNVVCITGSGGCVDCDTEYFNGYEWKRIADYAEGDKVLQYNEDGTANLVVPQAYVKFPAKTLYRAETKYGLDMCLSPEHNVYYITSKGNLYHKSWSEIIQNHENSVQGFSGKFITSFYAGGDGIDLTDNQIKLMLAVIADGSLMPTNGNYTCRFHIKKERKKKALREIFEEGKWQYKERESVAPGYTDFYVNPPRLEKQFGQYWYNCSQEQLQLICANVLQWDGCIQGVRRSFSTSIKETADFIQYAFAACGYKAVIKCYDRKGQKYLTNGKYYTRISKEYDVIITDRTLVSIGGFHRENKKTKIVPYETTDGFKYCFTVPTHMWIMRRNGKIVITGNTGKTTTLTPIVEVMRHANKSFCQCALSGKASSNLEEITGQKGYTIHRLLKWSPVANQFLCNAEHPLRTDMVIVDEISMVEDGIFLSLLKAIPNGAKLVLLGDIQQLEAIGPGAVALDMLKSPLIKSKCLTKIHRQAAASGIITESLKASKGEQIVENLPTVETRGILQDLKIRSYSDSILTADNIMEEYTALYHQGVKPKDLAVVVPMKERGAASCYALNQRIQELVNPPCPGIPEVVVGPKDKPITLRKFDKIIIMTNHYRECFPMDVDVTQTITQEDIKQSVPIYNGNTGFLVDIKGSYLVVDLVVQGLVQIPRKYWKDINLGYALTCHKCVHEDTWILTDRGPLQIKDLNNGALPMESRPMDNPPLVFNGEFWERPSHFYNAGISEGYEIRTRYGRCLKCTVDHGLDIWLNGSIEHKMANQLKIGDYLVFPKNSVDLGNDGLLPVEWNEYKLDCRSIKYKKPERMTPDFAQFLGMCVADGCLHRRGVKYFKNSIPVAREFGRLLDKLFGYHGAVFRKHSSGNAWGYECSSVDIANWLSHIEGLTPHDKNIPSCIFSASLESKRAFLRGFFEDGAVHMKKGRFDMVELYSEYSKLRDQIIYLLQEVGIIASANYRSVTLKTGTVALSYGVQIYGENARIFAKTIGFLNPLKQERVNDSLNRDNSLSSQVIQSDERNVYLPITKITPITLQSYCLTMPQSHRFVQNGMIGSNCQGSASPYVIVGLDNTAYTLLCKEWVYTALTRAKKYCVFVAQISAARTAVSTTRVLHKHTWLQELLPRADKYVRGVLNDPTYDSPHVSYGDYRYWPESIGKAEREFKVNIKENSEAFNE